MKKPNLSLEDHIFLHFMLKNSKGEILPENIEMVSKGLPPVEELIENAN